MTITMISSTLNIKLTKSAFAFVFGILLFVPITIEKAPVSHSFISSMDETSYIGLNLSPATVHAQTQSGFAMPEKKDSSDMDLWPKVVTFVGNLVLGIGAFFAWATGNLLDYSLQSLVFGMGDLINNQGVGIAIDAAWKVIRDFCNLAFIFGFIYLGIRTIIDPDSSSVKRTLSQIIIGAFLINFSLYIAKFIIDFSNFTAYSIYNAMVVGDGSISTFMFKMLGVTTFYSGLQIDTTVYQNLTGTGILAYYLVGMLLLLVAAFVFLATAILLVTRFVALVFLMIASPVLFAATVFPQTESTAKKLWGKLLSYSFFAPLYLFLTLISLLIMDAFVKTMAGTKKLSAALTGSPAAMDSFGVVVSFVVVAFFLIESLLISKKLGVAGSDAMIGWGQKLKGNAQSFVGRNTIGRIGEYTNRKIQDARESGSTSRRALGWVGSATVGGAANAAAGAKWGGSQSRNDAKKEDQELDRKRAKVIEVGKISNTVSESTRLDKERRKVEADASATQAQKDAARKASEDADMRMERALAGASTEQTLDLLKKHKNGDERDTIVANLSASQFDSVMKSKPEDLDDAKKEELRSQRSAAVQKRLVDTENRKHTAAGTPPTATIGDVIGKADAKELDAMDFETVVLANAGKLSSKQVDDMSLTPTAKNRLKDARNTALITEFDGGAGAVDLFKRITSETERAKLHKDILTNPAAAEYLTQGVLTKILDNDGIPMADRPGIRKNVETYHRGKATEKNFRKFFNNTPAGQQYI